MPPKGRKPETPSESSDEGSHGEEQDMDFSRFTNPNFHREFVAGLPEAVRNRVKALNGMDKAYSELRKAHEEQMVKLTRKYELLMQPLFARRQAIVSGEAPVTEEDIKRGYPSEHEGKVAAGTAPAAGSPLPNFWSRALHHHCIIDDLITERDDEAMQHLLDVRVATLEAPLVGFLLQFTFRANEFFEETVLNKTFYLTKVGEEWTLEKTESTPITWKAGKNLLVKTVTKKQKSKSKKGAVRYVTEEEPCESFFHFFDADEDDDGFQEQWFAMAQTIKDKIVPFAVDYYTGEAPDGSSDIDDDDYDGEEDEEEEDEEEEEEPAPRPGRGGASGGRGGYSGGAQPPARGAGGKQPQECKQQ